MSNLGPLHSGFLDETKVFFVNISVDCMGALCPCTHMTYGSQCGMHNSLNLTHSIKCPLDSLHINIYKWYMILGMWPHHYLCLQISLCAIITRGVPSVLMRPFHLASDHLGPMMASETWHIRISIGTILWWCYTIARTHNTRDKGNVEPTNVNLDTQKTPTAPLLPYS